MVDLEVFQEQKVVKVGYFEEKKVVFVDLESIGGDKDYSRIVQYCYQFLVDIDLG